MAVVGAGYTGLWSAYYLAIHQPDLRVAVVESEVAGFGASGRNGGWCSAKIAGHRAVIARKHGRDAAVRLQRAMFATVDEVGRVAAREGIDAHFDKGGTVTLATAPGHVPRLQASIDLERTWGFGAEDWRWLDAAAARERLEARTVLGAVYTPHCAALHPARLVRGLAEAVERKGVRIFERTPALAIEPGRVVTAGGTVTASNVLRCTEAFTPALPGHRRLVAPVYSLMIATEPLSDRVWERIGLRQRETFSDGRHLVIYGQRTRDGRVAFGGRGAPYHFGSRVRPRFDHDPAVFAHLEQVLRELFPAVGHAAITHRWGGAVAIPRDWRASVGLDRATGRGWAGGYIGVGVGSSNLAGRTLADLVLERDTELVGLPWVGHRSRRWEPEPLRWLGINTGRLLAPAADRAEHRTGRPSRVLGGALRRLTGG